MIAPGTGTTVATGGGRRRTVLAVPSRIAGPRATGRLPTGATVTIAGRAGRSPARAMPGAAAPLTIVGRGSGRVGTMTNVAHGVARTVARSMLRPPGVNVRTVSGRPVADPRTVVRGTTVIGGRPTGAAATIGVRAPAERVRAGTPIDVRRRTEDLGIRRTVGAPSPAARTRTVRDGRIGAPTTAVRAMTAPGTTVPATSASGAIAGGTTGPGVTAPPVIGPGVTVPAPTGPGMIGPRLIGPGTTGRSRTVAGTTGHGPIAAGTTAARGRIVATAGPTPAAGGTSTAGPARIAARGKAVPTVIGPTVRSIAPADRRTGPRLVGTIVTRRRTGVSGTTPARRGIGTIIVPPVGSITPSGRPTGRPRIARPTSAAARTVQARTSVATSAPACSHPTPRRRRGRPARAARSIGTGPGGTGPAMIGGRGRPTGVTATGRPAGTASIADPGRVGAKGPSVRNGRTPPGSRTPARGAAPRTSARPGRSCRTGRPPMRSIPMPAATCAG